MSYLRAMLKRDREMKLTVGCRARLKPDSKSNWLLTLGKSDVLLTERAGDEFAALVLKENTGELKEDIKLIENEVAWLSERDLELVNMDFANNMRFIDWYQEAKESECPDCGQSIIIGKEKCPECGFSWE